MIPDLGKFALSINGDFIANIFCKVIDDKAIKSGASIKIFDADNDKLVRSKFFEHETEPMQCVVSTDGKTVAVSSFDNLNSVWIYSIS